MDLDTTLAAPIAALFRRLTTPRRLGEWLPDVVGVEAGGARHPGMGVEFALTLRQDGREVAATGEVVEYEPPWLVAYRLCAGERTHVVRVACTARGEGTHLHIHQGEGDGTLAVDLARLARAVAAGDGEWRVTSGE